uniref:NADH-ubiquinone oxidoreductase chain 4 n=1 Tax=Trinorchestia longiramus TaxID=1923959 RepID=A0A385UKU6_9CRUS|nr:NADH dehydrogenase subunit 4 [Trinorchestia longiramus]AYB71596.1 NADH dehydrogenase subunit 4 [Trinorchestia longiramus]
MLKVGIMLFCLCSCSWGETGLILSLSVFLFMLMNPVFEGMSMFFVDFDFFSWNLILLSIWVFLMAIFGSTSIKFFNKLNILYLKIMSALLFFLFLTFSVSDFLVFYIMFEACLIPILLMILGWGYQPERMEAGVYMFFYTLLGSLPLFFMILYLGNEMGCNYMYMMFGSGSVNSLVFLFLVGAFLVKFPMYSVHLWLLKAHVEAPVAGSMILAGVLLKLGGYGLVRFSPFFLEGGKIVKEFVIVFSVWGGLVLSLVCLRFSDMKLLIAASSVVHMSGCICGIFILSDWGLKGCLVMMLAHGICSSGLFYLANVVYERTNSRSMMVNKGLLSVMPVFSLWWFLLVVSNMAGPPSYNLAGEIMLLVSVVNWNNFMIVILFFLGFFSAAYSLYLYSFSQHGVFVKVKKSFMSGLVLEYFVLFLHWFPLNILILGLMMMLYLTNYSICGV